MPVQHNTGGPEDSSQQKPQTTGDAFGGTTFTGGTTTAPGGGSDILSLLMRSGVSRIDATVKPYLDKVMETVTAAYKDAELRPLQRTTNSYAVVYRSPNGAVNVFGIVFVSPTDNNNPKFAPLSNKIAYAIHEIREMFKSERVVRVIDSRLIFAGNQAEMDRGVPMGNTIVMSFQVTSDPSYKDLTISKLTAGFDYQIDFSLAEARAMAANLSPHSVPARMDIGMVLRMRVPQMNIGFTNQNAEANFIPVGVIGGYIEVKAKERVQVDNQTQLRYRPLLNITTLNSAIPLEGIGAILLAAFIPNVVNTPLWWRQWSNLGNRMPNPSMLEPDPDNPNKPLELNTTEELHQFLEHRFVKPVVAFHFQDGKDAIPGMWRMASTKQEERTHFLDRLTHFFEVEQESQTIPLTGFLEERYEGVVGNRDAQMSDSRTIDYLQIIASHGVASITGEDRNVMLGTGQRPEVRAGIVSTSVQGQFLSAYNTISAVIDPNFIGWINNKAAAKRLSISDPNGQGEMRPLGSVLSGMGSFDQIGSIVTQGGGYRGYNQGSVWSF